MWSDNIKTFCQSVCEPIKHAAPWEKADITKELSDHIEDHAQDLIRFGYSEEDAYNRAISAMGNPDEIGGELNKQYPLFWLVFSRIPLIIIAVLLFQFWGVPNSLMAMKDNLLARTNPYFKLNDFEIVQDIDPESINRTDIRIELAGDNVLRVFAYKEGFEPGPNDGYLQSLGYDRYALVFICMYNKKPIQEVYSNFQQLKSKQREFIRKDYTKNYYSGAAYCVLHVPYNSGDKAIQFCYDAYLQTIQLSIDINQERAGI